MASTTLHQAGPVQGPAWDLSDEYPAATAQEVDAELQSLSDLLDRIDAINPRLTVCGDAQPCCTTRVVAGRSGPTLAYAMQ